MFCDKQVDSLHTQSIRCCPSNGGFKARHELLTYLLSDKQRPGLSNTCRQKPRQNDDNAALESNNTVSCGTRPGFYCSGALNLAAFPALDSSAGASSVCETSTGRYFGAIQRSGWLCRRGRVCNARASYSGDETF